LPHLLSTSCNVLSSFSRFPFVICGHLLSVESINIDSLPPSTRLAGGRES
jgi:hypothetical protein